MSSYYYMDLNLGLFAVSHILVEKPSDGMMAVIRDTSQE